MQDRLQPQPARYIQPQPARYSPHTYVYDVRRPTRIGEVLAEHPYKLADTAKLWPGVNRYTVRWNTGRVTTLYGWHIRDLADYSTNLSNQQVALMRAFAAFTSGEVFKPEPKAAPSKSTGPIYYET